MFLKLFLIFFSEMMLWRRRRPKNIKKVRKRSKMIQERTKTVRKTETTKFEIICSFTRFLRSCAIIELSTPPPVDLKTQEKKNKKQESNTVKSGLLKQKPSAQTEYCVWSTTYDSVWRMTTYDVVWRRIRCRSSIGIRKPSRNCDGQKLYWAVHLQCHSCAVRL